MNYWIKSLIFSGLALSLSAHASTERKASFSDPVYGTKTITYQVVNGHAVVEGDILINTSNKSLPGAVITNKLGGLRWPKGQIPYEVNESLPFANKLAVYQAIELWQKLTHVKFIELNSKNKDGFKDYLSFNPIEGSNCSSFVGKQGGKQLVLLSPRCNTMNVAHELGHALGLWHEQSRADRDSYVQIVWENIEDKYKYNFDQQLSNGTDFGEYDYDSIMHYGPYSFSKNGKKTIVPLSEGADIGQRNHISTKDIAAVKAMYPES